VINAVTALTVIVTPTIAAAAFAVVLLMLQRVRRRRDRLEWLAERELVVMEREPGVPTRVVLLEETGSGKPYQVPGIAGSKAKTDGREVPDHHVYVKVPSELWTRGWIVTLTAPALAVLLMLLVEKGGRKEDANLSLAQSTVKNRYDLSSDTLYRGVRELRDEGIVELLGRESGRLDEFRRRHNVYRLHLERLQNPPSQAGQDKLSSLAPPSWLDGSHEHPANQPGPRRVGGAGDL
jgi:hypothetical protein